MSVNRATEVWKEIKPFALRDLGLLDAKSKDSGKSGYFIILYDESAKKLRYYSASSDGLKAALAAANSGDIVWMPACTISDAQVVPAGVSLVGADRDRCVLTGQVALGAGSVISNLSISLTGLSSATAIVTAGGDAFALDCKLSVVLTGGTPRIAFLGSDLYLLSCELVCTLNGVDATPFSQASGGAYHFTDSAEGWVVEYQDMEVLEYLQAEGKFRVTWVDDYNWGGGAIGFDPVGLIAIGGETISVYVGYHIYDDTYRESSFGTITLTYSDASQTIQQFTPPSGSGFQWFYQTNAITIPPEKNGLQITHIKIDQQRAYGVGGHGMGGYSFDDVILSGSGGDVFVHSCSGLSGYGIPLEGDRSAFDASAYPLLHANDTDDAAASLHHTIGTGATQAAAGNHIHLLNKLNATVAPAVTDDSGDGYSVGSIWVDLTHDKAYICVDATIGAAVWNEAGASGAITVEEIDGSPSVATVTKIKVPNGSLTNDGAGVVTFTPPGSGDVVGPASSIDGHLVVFNGATGKAVKDGGPIPAHIDQIMFSVEGTLTVANNPLRIYNATGITRTISKVFIAVDTAPTGAGIIVDIHKDGTTIFTTQANRPTIAAAGFTGFSTTIEVPTWADGSYLTMHIDQIGSTIAGSNIVVTVVYS